MPAPLYVKYFLKAPALLLIFPHQPQSLSDILSHAVAKNGRQLCIVEILNFLMEGRLDRFSRLKISRNAFVVPSRNGFPGTFFLPAIQISFFSSSVLMTPRYPHHVFFQFPVGYWLLISNNGKGLKSWLRETKRFVF